MNRSGFTLVELMIVAIIVSILAAVAVPLMSGNAKRAATTEAMAAIRVIKQAYKIHQDELGYRPNVSPVDIFPEIRPGDLNGTYFNDDSYTLSVNSGNYIITCTPRAGAKHLDPTADTLSFMQIQGYTRWSGTLAP